MDRLVVVVNVVFTKKLIQTSTSSIFFIQNFVTLWIPTIQYSDIHAPSLLQIPQIWFFSQIEDTY